MWNETAATRLLKIAYPIVQGPFGGGLSSVGLAATVSNLGGLGSFGAHIFSPGQIGDIVAHLRERTASPFAINLWVDNADPAMAQFDQASFERHVERLRAHYATLGLDLPKYPDRFGQNFDEQVEALIEAAPPVFSFVFGIPSPQVLQACRSRGILTVGNATTVEEARDGEWAERGEITLEAAAKLIGVCNMTALRMLPRGDIKGRQACAGAPWVVRSEDLAGFAKGKRRKPPLTQNATQRVLDFQ